MGCCTSGCHHLSRLGGLPQEAPAQASPTLLTSVRRSPHQLEASPKQVGKTWAAGVKNGGVPTEACQAALREASLDSPLECLESHSTFLPVSFAAASRESPSGLSMYDDIESSSSISSSLNTADDGDSIERLEDNLTLRQASHSCTELSALPPTTKSAIASADSLAGHAWEFERLVRPPLTCGEDLRCVGAQLADAHAFVAAALPQAAEAVGSKTLGPVFQALLAQRRSASLVAVRPLFSSRTQPVDVDMFQCESMSLDSLGLPEVRRLAAASENLCGLLRVKVADDSDLELACTLLQDCLHFLESLSVHAQQRNISSWELFTEVLHEGDSCRNGRERRSS